MASSHKKRTGVRIALVVLLCCVLVCVVGAAVLLGLAGRRVKALQAGASFTFDYQITATGTEQPALYKLLEQFGGTTGSVEGQYAPDGIQLSLSSETAAIPASPLSRVYIGADETLFDVGQLYRNIRKAVVDEYPLSSLLLPDWTLGSYISQSQIAAVLGVDADTVALQDMTGFALDLKKLQRVQPENALDGYLYFQLENTDTAADAPQLTIGVAKKGLLLSDSHPAHILLDIPAHGVHIELTGTVTAAKTVLTAPSSRMSEDDVAALVKLRETIESVLQFVQQAA